MREKNRIDKPEKHLKVTLSHDIFEKVNAIAKAKNISAEKVVVGFIKEGLHEEKPLETREQHLEQLKQIMKDHNLPDSAFKFLDEVFFY